MLRQFTRLYPEIENSDSVPVKNLSEYREELKRDIVQTCSKLIKSDQDLATLVSSFQKTKSTEYLQEICSKLFELFPIETNDIYHSMLPTSIQLKAYLSDKLENIGDCKLQTIICAYISNVIAEIPILFSVRQYNGHPIMYLQLSEGVYKVSFRYTGPTVKKYNGNNPFNLTKEMAYNPDFIDRDFKTGEEQSILYWDVINAIYILDNVNILRRCLVNYASNPDYYSEIFNRTVQGVKQSNVYSEPITEYWEIEMRRIKDIWSDPRTPKDPSRFKQLVVDSLRFTE